MRLESSEAAAITGWSSSTPSLDPLSILMLEYQTFGERAITRAVTGSVPCGKPSSLWSPTSPLSCAASRCAVRVRASSERSSIDLALERLVLVLGVDGVADPAEQVAHRLERAARARLDRRERLLRAALEAWKKPPPDSPK